MGENSSATITTNNYKLMIGRSISYALRKLLCKILISEIRWIVVLHEVNDSLLNPIWTFPVTPKPFGNESGNRINAEVDENADFRFVEPLNGIKKLYYKTNIQML